MSVGPGTKLGPYAITAAIGAGGMGEVFRARDTRLGRDVAIKVLPPTVAGDPDALARFDREARAVAALNHPNIVALFDIGKEGDTAFVVTELLEGQTLRERISAGPIPSRLALEYARSIADALAAAHDRGIVHRDVKPENVFITADGRVKVLDFGLAQVSGASDSASQAETKISTSPGLVVGTVGYMAPEQVRGQKADSRTDIFAFGLVLYEMLSGTRAFSGATNADTMSAVLNQEPAELGSVSGTVIAPGIERIVRRCLEKNPAQRFQSARDLSFAIEAVSLGGSGAKSAPDLPIPARRPKWWPLAAAALIVAAIAGAFVIGRQMTSRTAAAGPVQRFMIPGAVNTGVPAVAISPDGKFLIYSNPATGQSAGGSAAFWLQEQATMTLTQLSGVAAGISVLFWSPDSKSIGFFRGAEVFAMDMPNGLPRLVATLPEFCRRGAWGSRGTIIATSGTTVYQVPATGGTPVAVVKIAPGKETAIYAPSFLPDGERFLATVVTGPGEGGSETHAFSLDGKRLGTIAKAVVGGFYADGHLVYGAHGGLYAQALDAASLKVSGDPVLLASTAMQDARLGNLHASASETGTLAYRPAPNIDAQFQWVDRNGRQLSSVATTGSFTNFNVSPDGARIAATRRDPVTSESSLWMIDAVRGVASLVSPKDDVGYGDPMWMPDGQRVVFRHQRSLSLRSANGGEMRSLVPAAAYPDSVSSDGRYVLYGAPNGPTYELYALDILTANAKPIPVVTGLSLADEGKFSPNGKWVAYHSDETKSNEVSVVPFPPTGEKWQISQTGGLQPRWSKDGNELFYLDLSGRMMSVKMPGSDPRRASSAVVLFPTTLVPSNSLDQYEPVGDRFLIRVPLASPATASPVGVIVNWPRITK
jgi:Tol biopolymer transport system component